MGNERDGQSLEFYCGELVVRFALAFFSFEGFCFRFVLLAFS